MIKVSVIIPVYKVESFIERCALSLFNQTMGDIEYIFIDDASPDNSIEIVNHCLESFPLRKKDTIIIQNFVNKGISTVRNIGLDKASGEYIFFCDSDDWVEQDMLEKMYNMAIDKKADIVYCDFFLSFNQKERYMPNPTYQRAEEMLKQGFLCGLMKYNLWNKLIKKELFDYETMRFPVEHSVGEDMLVIRLTSNAKKVNHLPEALYHYVKLNGNAYSNSYSQKNLEDIRFNADITIDYLKKRYGKDIEQELALFKLSTKLPFLITDDKNIYKIWREWYPEANKYAFSNKNLPMRTRLLQEMAAKNKWWYVKLYYKFVYKFVYGFIYK